jgi:hypothetical protein
MLRIARRGPTNANRVGVVSSSWGSSDYQRQRDFENSKRQDKYLELAQDKLRSQQYQYNDTASERDYQNEHLRGMDHDRLDFRKVEHRDDINLRSRELDLREEQNNGQLRQNMGRLNLDRDRFKNDRSNSNRDFGLKSRALNEGQHQFDVKRRDSLYLDIMDRESGSLTAEKSFGSMDALREMDTINSGEALRHFQGLLDQAENRDEWKQIFKSAPRNLQDLLMQQFNN